MNAFDQLAMAFVRRADQLAAAQAMREKFNAKFITEDFVRTVGVNYLGTRISNTAHLMFDYGTWPMEYELLHYVSGWNWHELRSESVFASNFLSHFGVHVDTEQEVNIFRERYKMLQEVVTVSHTNQNILKLGRRYHYVIFDARRDLGCELKTIRRITADEAITWADNR